MIIHTPIFLFRGLLSQYLHPSQLSRLARVIIIAPLYCLPISLLHPIELDVLAGIK